MAGCTIRTRVGISLRRYTDPRVYDLGLLMDWAPKGMGHDGLEDKQQQGKNRWGFNE